jgi:hypothetical protein
VNTAEVVTVIISFAGALVGSVWAVAAALGSRIGDVARRVERLEDAVTESNATMAQLRTDLAVIRTELVEHGRRLDRVER